MKGEARVGALLQGLLGGSAVHKKIESGTHTRTAAPSPPAKAIVNRHSYSARKPVEHEIRSEKAELNRQRRGKMAAPALLEQVLGKTLSKYGLEKGLARYRFVAEWSGVVGETAAAVSRPEYIRNHTLYIRVATSQWAQLLSFKQMEIMERLAPMLEDSEDTVAALRFIVGGI